MKEFFVRLGSRKFLLAVGATATFYANKQYSEAALTVMAYLGVEGAADFMDRR